MEIIKVKGKNDLLKDIKEQKQLEIILDDAFTCDKCGNRFEVCICSDEKFKI